MSGDNYILYLDESKFKNNKDEARFQECFCVAGVVIKESQLPELDAKLNALKRGLWPDNTNAEKIVLHEVDIRAARNRRSSSGNYNVFRSNQKYRAFYEGLADIIESLDLRIIGASLNTSEISLKYNESHHTYEYNVAMQCIIENYCQFLNKKNAKGLMVLESRNEVENNLIKSKFYYLKAMGTMFVSSKALQNRIKEIEFINKYENNSGVQLADFIPYYFARKHTGADYQQPKIIKFNDALRVKRWDGGCLNASRFGIKIIE